MIFVTTGTQLPFARLIEAIDSLAPELDEPIIAQTGADPSPRQHLDCRERLTPAEFDDLFEQARVVVAHAGIGTILSAKMAQKPLVIMPRRHNLGEHRNDHQMATAQKVKQLQGIYVAQTTTELATLLKSPNLRAATPNLGSDAEALIARVRSFIDGH